MSQPYEYSVIIPTLIAGDDLRDTLESLSADTDAPSHEVIVVLNSQSRPEFELKNINPNARLVQTGSNLGFAGACNLGARDAVGKILVFINDDMRVKSGFLNAFRDGMNRVGCKASGGRILSTDGKKFDFDGSSINLLGWGFQRNHGEPVTDNEFSSPSHIPFACGGNFAIESSLFEKSGGFDETYFAFYEDVDLGWRLALMGNEIAYIPDAVAFHKCGATGNLIPPALKWFLQERNALITIVKNYSDEILNKILPIAIALVAVRASILGGIDMDDIAQEKTWRDWIVGPPKESTESHGIWQGLMDGVKESIKSGQKKSRGANLPHGWLPFESKGAASLLAVEWCLDNWDILSEKRRHVQKLRIKNDREILPLFDDPMRPILGHPREVAAMAPLTDILNDLTGSERP